MIKKEDITSLLSNDELASKYNKMFERAKNFNQARQSAYTENAAFYEGNQNLLKQYVSTRPWVISMNTPYASVAIDSRVCSLITNNYIGELFPLSPEDVEPVKTVGKFIKDEWKRMKLDSMIDDSISDASYLRESYIHIVVNKDKLFGGKNRKRKGVLEAYAIDCSSIYIDPESRSLKNANYMIVTERISRDESINKYPEIKDSLDEFSIGSVHTPEDRGEIFVGQDYTTEQEGILTKKTFYEKEYIDYSKKEKGVKGLLGLSKTTKRHMIKKTIMIENKVVEQYYLPVSHFPIAQFRWKKVKKSCYGLSLMDDLIYLQKSINAIESAITNCAVAYASPSIIVRKGSGLDPKQVARTVSAPGVVYAVDGDIKNAISTLNPPQIDDRIINLKKDNEIAIEKISGSSKQFLGNIGTAGNTSNGAERVIDRATQIENKVLRNIEEFIADLTEIIFEHIAYLYAGDTVYLRGTKNQVSGEYNFDSLKIPDNIEDLSYEFYVNLSKRSPYNKEKEKEKIMELFTVQNQYDAEVKAVSIVDIIRMFDFENEEEIVTRYNEMLKSTSGKKADLIQSLVMLGNNQGIPPEMIAKAITEIIVNSNETPTVQAVMETINKKMAEQQQANQAQMDQANSDIEQNSQELSNMGISPEAIQMATEAIGGQTE